MNTLTKKVPTIGLIGLGNQGRKHLSSILHLENKKKLKLVGICDVSFEKCTLSKIPFYTNYKDLYSKAKPDIIVIASPNFLHKKMALDALAKQINVIKEKPLAVNFSDASKIIESSQKFHKHVITMQQRFFSPAFLKAKNVIASNPEKIVSFSYRFTLNDTVKSWYWDYKKSGGGSWLNMGWHAISVIQWLIGDIKTVELDWKINGRREWDYDTDHSSFARVVTKDNIPGTVFLSCVYPKKEEVLKIVFSSRIIYLSRNSLKIITINNTRKEQVYNFTAKEKDIYNLQLEEILKKINSKDHGSLTNDLKIMAIIQAGMDSIFLKSSDSPAEKNYGLQNDSALSNKIYANF